MDKLVAADVDAHVGDAAAGGLGEKDQIAGLHIARRYRLSGVSLGGAGMAEIDAEVGEDIPGEAGTVKPSGRGTAIDVGASQILLLFDR